MDDVLFWLELECNNCSLLLKYVGVGLYYYQTHQGRDESISQDKTPPGLILYLFVKRFKAFMEAEVPLHYIVKLEYDHFDE